MKNNKSKYVYSFIDKFQKDRACLIKKIPIWREIQIINLEGSDVIEFPNIPLLAAFYGYLKSQFNKRNNDIFIRGEKDFYSKNIPYLFRNNKSNKMLDNIRIDTRFKALTELAESIPKLFSASRFDSQTLPPLLQHYGIKTNWLDLVDNLFVALWFASHKSKTPYSYLKFFCNSSDNESSLKIFDLRKEFSSLSLRLHCQHGLSATKRVHLKKGGALQAASSST